MLLALSAALALTFQFQIGARHSGRPAVRDSASSVATATSGNRNSGIRRAVSAQDQRSAFKDAPARATMLRARAARMVRDSALVAYDAMSYSRMSTSMSLTRIARERILFRHESVARVRWREGVGVWMEELGQRTGTPFENGEMREEMRREMRNDPDLNAAIPYYPGYEPFWVGNGVARAQVDEEEVVNPIADGAEAYYTYESGDSARFTLPNGTSIPLREIRVRSRVPKWNLIVGSLWFDTNSGQLVRAAYRLSVAMDIWEAIDLDDPAAAAEVPAWVRPMVTPMKASITTIALEYGLHEGRFWLPRLRLAEGTAQMSVMRMPFKLEQRFKYASVNGADPLPQIVLDPASTIRAPDSLTVEQQRQWRDSVRQETRAQLRAVHDSIGKGLKVDERRKAQCDTSSTVLATSIGYDSHLKVAVRTPCDLSTIENSPEFPHALYDKGEELFGSAELEELKAQALSLGSQSQLSLRRSMLPPPDVAFGLAMTRYNRVEGLSTGVSIEQQVGGGYSGLAIVRFGLADREPNVEFSATRSNLAKWISVSAYNRLVSLSDWGHPLSFGSSLSALMFGRDEGFYFRASGAELSGQSQSPMGGGPRLEWRAFVERQRAAETKASFAVSGPAFPPNVVARRGTYSGVGARVYHDYGLDPHGLRMMTDLRVEAARGDSLYGRAALDVTASRGFGTLAGAITVAGGGSLGTVPAQRRWYLGGVHTVRGQSPDTAQSGNAFWLARAELGMGVVGVRPAVFADVGWAGDRTKLKEVGRPLSGVGAGVSFVDGLFRIDVARGLHPRKQTRVDLYLESKF